MGDLSCQVAAAQHGDRRLTGLVAKYGWDTVRTYSEALIDYSERMLRAEIEKIPDGTYEAEGWLDDDGMRRHADDQAKSGYGLYLHALLAEGKDTP